MSSIIRTMAAVAAAIVTTAPAVAQLPVDDARVRQLESEVLHMQSELDAQSRRIETLEQAARIAPPAVLLAPGPRQDSSPAWLVPSSWDRLKPGMTALEVISILGRPTSTRHSDDGKLTLMFYAMELGPSAFLSGTIRVNDSGAVVEINRPVLK
ncbi:MAG TPA: hypothetical protein VMH77_04095 [Steroidobacteraceae bacterium]|nr:hypothetical protein [Steroidobacteraceae bacterium]